MTWSHQRIHESNSRILICIGIIFHQYLENLFLYLFNSDSDNSDKTVRVSISYIENLSKLHKETTTITKI